MVRVFRTAQKCVFLELIRRGSSDMNIKVLWVDNVGFARFECLMRPFRIKMYVKCSVCFAESRRDQNFPENLLTFTASRDFIYFDTK